MTRTAREKGTALLAVLILIMLLGAFASALMSSVHGLRKVQRHAWQRAACDAAARAGIERALWELERDPDFQKGDGQVAGATYEVTSVQPEEAPADREVIASGSVEIQDGRQMTRTIRVRIRISPSIGISEWLE